MRSRLLFAPLLFVVAACASSQSRPDAPPVTVQLAPLNQMSNIFYFAGPINLQYQLSIANPSDEPLHLRRLDLQTSGSGAYVLHNSSPMNVSIPPKSTATVTIAVWGRALGGYLHSSEPVTLRWMSYFDSPKGSFVKVEQGIQTPE